MSRPHNPPTTMMTNAATRALTVGSAVGPSFGNRNDSFGSDTRES